MLKTGILLPRSNIFPSLGLDILNGLKENLKLAEQYEQFTFITENIGFGVDEAEVYSKAEKMLLQDDADVVILCADVKMADILQPLFAASNKILLVVNPGANFPENWSPSPTTITHTLNFCMHASLTGRQAAIETNKNAINTASYFDAGYRQCFSMLNSHQLSGGKPLITHITSASLAEFTLEPVAAFLQEHKEVNTLLCLFAGAQAEKFYQQVAPLQKQYGLCLYVSPMMIDGQLKKTFDSSFRLENVKGYLPWHSSLSNDANREFGHLFSGNKNYFSLLGWETGTILNEIKAKFDVLKKDAAAVVTSLAGKKMSSPRGWLMIDPATQHTYGPSYPARYSNDMEVLVEEQNATTENEWNTFVSEAAITGDYSGWRNTYLCV
jgi:branched-chain amino acid transport system substrate-binding protein